MLNQVVFVGRLANDVVVQKKNKEKMAVITLEISKRLNNEKNSEGNYYIDCTLLGDVAANAKSYCEVGSIVGVKGHIESRTKLNDNNVPIKIVAEKVTFLSAGKENTNN